ncbi:DNA/RNA polymerases superfamily protein [Gossypium australe]|uniref:DNA/RNA polymerases superfamily protein n=1 Tax=Gossypium australe TaxID=47621 RepID=A0A5B6WJ77_9ROSI|nr:DNA/RNA polymerases superfamily protein [Gossypium australe]
MLRAYVIDFELGWEHYLPLVEFVYNNSLQLSSQIAPYEVLYGCRCRTPVCWSDLCERKVVGSKLIQETKDIVKSYADMKRRDIEFSMGDKVFLKVSSWKKIMRSVERES